MASATFKPSQEWEARMLMDEVIKGADEKGCEVGYRAVRRYTVSVIMTSKKLPYEQSRLFR